MARDRFGSIILETASGVSQATEMFLGFYCTDTGMRVVRRWNIGERRVVLFATERMLLICHVHLPLVLSAGAHGKDDGMWR